MSVEQWVADDGIPIIPEADLDEEVGIALRERVAESGMSTEELILKVMTQCAIVP